MQHEPKPGQVWEVYSPDEQRWRRAAIVNIVMTKVELRYLDMGDAPDIARTVYADRAALDGEPDSYRFVAEEAPAG